MLGVEEAVTYMVRLHGFFRREAAGRWVSVCPSLELYSQGTSETQARENLQEAIELWFESCIERNTLARALTELGWHRTPLGAPVPDGEDTILEVPAGSVPDSFGQSFPLEVRIPAYQAAAQM